MAKFQASFPSVKLSDTGSVDQIFIILKSAPSSSVFQLCALRSRAANNEYHKHIETRFHQGCPLVRNYILVDQELAISFGHGGSKVRQYFLAFGIRSIMRDSMH